MWTIKKAHENMYFGGLNAYTLKPVFTNLIDDIQVFDNLRECKSLLNHMGNSDDFIIVRMSDYDFVVTYSE